MEKKLKKMEAELKQIEEILETLERINGKTLSVFQKDGEEKITLKYIDDSYYEKIKKYLEDEITRILPAIIIKKEEERTTLRREVDAEEAKEKQDEKKVEELKEKILEVDKYIRKIREKHGNLLEESNVQRVNSSVEAESEKERKEKVNTIEQNMKELEYQISVMSILIDLVGNEYGGKIEYNPENTNLELEQVFRGVPIEKKYDDYNAVAREELVTDIARISTLREFLKSYSQYNIKGESIYDTRMESDIQKIILEMERLIDGRSEYWERNYKNPFARRAEVRSSNPDFVEITSLMKTNVKKYLKSPKKQNLNEVADKIIDEMLEPAKMRNKFWETFEIAKKISDLRENTLKLAIKLNSETENEIEDEIKSEAENKIIESAEKELEYYENVLRKFLVAWMKDNGRPDRNDTSYSYYANLALDYMRDQNIQTLTIENLESNGYDKEKLGEGGHWQGKPLSFEDELRNNGYRNNR